MRRGGEPVEGSVADRIGEVRERVSQVIVGLEDVVEVLLVAMMSGGHVLLEGPPGLGKTTLAKTFAQTIGGTFKRIQMTPDLLPADILGVNVYNPFDSTWVLRRGPIFANVVLVDELNRASPKVQSAFLEVMQEQQVTIENETLALSSPFMVLATQLPYGEQGTYPLTSVQIDRFSYRVEVHSPDPVSEAKILGRVDMIDEMDGDVIIDSKEILELSKMARSVYVDDSVKKYIVDLVQYIRRSPHVRMGPSPRASIWLYRGSRVKAMMDGRGHVLPDDVKGLVDSVIPHRIELKPQARAGEVTPMSLVEEALEKVAVPKGIE